MTLREITEERERKTLSPFAALSVQSEGRLWPIEPCPIRTCYQRDIDRIVHSKAFRRLMHKTQVFLQPEGDHYRTRMTHTLEVARIARTITRALRLNEDLTEAAALGHDLGHTPFGHAGEVALTEVLGRPFRHNEQSLRVVDVIERDGRGLGLTDEVRDGIVHHTGSVRPRTLEGRIVAISDRIAVMNQGAIEQLDSPTEIYDNPHSRFVAGFIGEMNFLDEGGAVLAVRPEDIALRSASGAGMARIESVMPLGHYTQIILVRADGARLKVFIPKEQALGYIPGQTADYSFTRFKQFGAAQASA